LRAVGEAALQAGVDPRSLREAIASMLEEAQRLTDLTDALLMLARLETGTGAQKEAVDLADLMQSVQDTLSVLAENKHQDLASTIPDCAILVSGNALLLRHALLNIVHNAICYSPADSSIRIELERRGDQALMEVSDEGPGISPDLQHKVFDRFFRLDAARSRDTGGHGLGLAIAKSVIEKHGGTIGIRGRQGSGTTFHIELPVASDQ
jgi:signal transduction histidine kinase